MTVHNPAQASESGGREQEHGKNRLLENTIGLLAKSSRIRLVFCPAVESLRAYISDFHVPRRSERMVPAELHGERPVLAVLDLLGLHYSTARFSVLELSRTLASLVEAAARETSDLVLSECADIAYPADGEPDQALWYAALPLLRSSGTAEQEEDNNIRTGGRVPVRRVVQKWFDYEENSRTIDKSTTI